MHNINVPSSFLMKSIGAPRGEMLALIYFLSHNSYNCIFSSINLGILIRYGSFETREDLGFKSIVKSMPYLGGKPKIALRNMSRTPSRLQSLLGWVYYIHLLYLSGGL